MLGYRFSVIPLHIFHPICTQVFIPRKILDSTLYFKDSRLIHSYVHLQIDTPPSNSSISHHIIASDESMKDAIPFLVCSQVVTCPIIQPPASPTHIDPTYAMHTQTPLTTTYYRMLIYGYLFILLSIRQTPILA